MSDPRMIPADEAQALQGAATKGPWAIDPDGDVIKPHSYDAEFSVYICSPEDGNRELVAAAPDLAHTVVEQAARIEQLDTELRARAADTLEYRVEHQHIENGVWHPLMQWSPEWPLNDGYSVAPDERIVCRRVSHPREVTDV